MEDNELDKLLATYKVADADKALVDGIVALAKAQPANENSRSAWLRHAAMFAVVALLGFYAGHATKPAQHSTAAQTTSETQQDYLDRMIMGPTSLDDMRL